MDQGDGVHGCLRSVWRSIGLRRTDAYSGLALSKWRGQVGVIQALDRGMLVRYTGGLVIGSSG